MRQSYQWEKEAVAAIAPILDVMIAETRCRQKAAATPADEALDKILTGSLKRAFSTANIIRIFTAPDSQQVRKLSVEMMAGFQSVIDTVRKAGEAQTLSPFFNAMVQRDAREVQHQMQRIGDAIKTDDLRYLAMLKDMPEKTAHNFSLKAPDWFSVSCDLMEQSTAYFRAVQNHMVKTAADLCAMGLNYDAFSGKPKPPHLTLVADNTRKPPNP